MTWKSRRLGSWQDRNRNRVNRLSSRQYSMAAFLEGIRGRVISYDVLASLNQATVGSFLVRGYLEEKTVRNEKVVVWTKTGSEAVKSFSKEKFDRVPTSRFSSALSLEVYDRSKS